MKLQSAFIFVSMFIWVCTAYRLNRFNRGKFADHWANKEDPGRDFYRKFGILDQSVFENPQVVILPRPYVNPNKDKYKKKKKRPSTRPYQGTSASESEGEENS